MTVRRDETERSPYLTEALNYIAERTIRKLTTQRNSMHHFGSDEGVEMAAAYHSVISTVKLHGMSAWDYLGEFFKKVFNGCRDFLSLTPANIGLAHLNVKTPPQTLTYLKLGTAIVPLERGMP